MHEEYEHQNGEIINGNWQSINNPDVLSPTINGKHLFEYVIASLKQHVNQLPSSNSLQDDNKMYIQIIANNSFSNYLFEEGPQELTIENKIRTLNYLNNLNALGETPIDPWDDICRILENEYVGQLIILSAWKPNTIYASLQKPCVGFSDGEFAEIVSEYNQFVRSKSAIGALLIDSISLYNNYCESSKNYFGNNWLGSIAKGAESECVHIK